MIDDVDNAYDKIELFFVIYSFICAGQNILYQNKKNTRNFSRKYDALNLLIFQFSNTFCQLCI